MSGERPALARARPVPEHPLLRARAARFASEIVRAMESRGVTGRALADATGCSMSSIAKWRRGFALPRLETARRLAAALDWVPLLTLAIDARSTPCDTCGGVFADDSPTGNRLYCSRPCRTARKEMLRYSPTPRRAVVAERRARALRRAVDAFCHACEPGGRCVTPACELRDVSPLPLRPASRDIEPVRGRGTTRAPRGAGSARMRGVSYAVSLMDEVRAR